VGYDNAEGKRQTLGRGQTGAKIAVPIFEQVMQASWQHQGAKTVLAPPSPQAQRQLIALPIELNTGDRLPDGTRSAFLEQFRIGATGAVDDTQYRLVPADETFRPEPTYDGEALGGWSNDYDHRFAAPLAPAFRDPPRGYPSAGGFGPRGFWDDDLSAQRRPRRVDPDYFWSRPRF
jgi:hypothetical protein